MSIDAPDWVKIVKSVPFTGADVDAPDWVRQVAGEGGVPIGGGLTYDYQYAILPVSVAANATDTLLTTGALDAGQWMIWAACGVQTGSPSWVGFALASVVAETAVLGGSVTSLDAYYNIGNTVVVQDIPMSCSGILEIATAGTLKLTGQNSTGTGVGLEFGLVANLRGPTMFSLKVA